MLLDLRKFQYGIQKPRNHESGPALVNFLTLRVILKLGNTVWQPGGKMFNQQSGLPSKWTRICVLRKRKQYFYFFFIYFYQLKANHFTILQWVLSYTDMNQPWIYMCSPSRSPSRLHPHPNPQGLPSAPAPEHLCHASNLSW